jgi:Rrf2 family iron-sulfur cluster assembly transcriptional regulator
MNITSKGRYALKIMLDLAQNPECKQQRHDIAERQGIPFDYIDHILARLRNANLISSIRGRNGGFILSRAPHEISAWDIFHAAEDSIHPVMCLGSEQCLNDDICHTKGVWEHLFEEIQASLERKTLQELVRVWKKSEIGDTMALSDFKMECKGPAKRLGGQVVEAH